jgi:hypothetical protein
LITAAAMSFLAAMYPTRHPVIAQVLEKLKDPMTRPSFLACPG